MEVVKIMIAYALLSHKKGCSLILAALALAPTGCGSDSFDGRQSPSTQRESRLKTLDATAQSADSQTTRQSLPTHEETQEHVQTDNQLSDTINSDQSTDFGQPAPEDDHRDFPLPTSSVDISGILSALFKPKPESRAEASSPDLSSDTATQPQMVCQEVATTVSKQKPIDLVFNIDVSTSMGDSLATVKHNAQTFAQRLSANGIDVRFAAVGYVDKPETFIGFTTSDSFAKQIAGWTLIDAGNQDLQEAGQAGLEYALWLLTQGRPGASKAIVHVSDAVSFAKENHSDLSVSALGSLFRSSLSSLGKILFYNSTPAVNGAIGYPIGQHILPYSPQDQMEDFRSAAGGLPGRALPFPFSAHTLTEELPIEIETAIEQKVVCQ